MTQQYGRLVAAVVVVVWGGRGRKGKNQYGQRTFPGAAERGDLLWGNDDLCQGWKGRQGASGTKVCANND